MSRLVRSLPIAALLLASCAGSVRVTDAGNGVQAAPKAKNCAIPFLRTKVPDREYVELAALHYGGGAFRLGDPAEAERALRERACALGADAVIVTRDFVPGVPGAKGTSPFMTGTAIVFKPTSSPASSPPARPSI
jgi:hypothetical protein